MQRVVVSSVILVAMATAAMAEPYPFEGKWDCEVAEFTFTGTTYNPGDQELEIQEIEEGEDQYTLTFADDYQITLDINDDGTMQWFSGETGDSFTCRPLP